MWEAEDGEAEKSKHTRLCGEKLKIVTVNVRLNEMGVGGLGG